MNKIKTLLELREKMKSKKPEFIRQDYNKKKKLGFKWRKPKGIHSKLREKRKGHRKTVSKGYRSPNAIRGFHASGLRVKIVNSIANIEKINKEEEGIIVGHGVGKKKRLEILMKAKLSNINILNINDIDAYIKKLEKVKIVKHLKPEHKQAKKEVPAKREEKEAKFIEVVD